MIRGKTLALALVSLGAALPAWATDPLSYSYLEANYLNSEVTVSDNTGFTADDDAEGFRLGLGIAMAKYVHFVADYDQRRYATERQSFQSAGLGANTRHPLFQFFGAATYERSEFDDNTAPANDEIDEGYGLTAGVRAPLPGMELHAAYKYIDWGKDGTFDITGARYGGGFLVQLTPKISFTADFRVLENKAKDDAGFEREEEYTEWTAGFRRYFATDSDRRKRKGGIFSGGE